MERSKDGNLVNCRYRRQSGALPVIPGGSPRPAPSHGNLAGTNERIQWKTLGTHDARHSTPEFRLSGPTRFPGGDRVFERIQSCLNRTARFRFIP